MNTVPNHIQMIAQEIANKSVPHGYGFPNGSSYERFEIPRSQRGDFEISGLNVRVMAKSIGVFDPVNKTQYGFEIRQNLGPGVELGKYFNSRSAESFTLVCTSAYQTA